jgi:hypothetical protein
MNVLGNAYKVLVDNFKGVFGNLSIDRSIILKWILWK